MRLILYVIVGVVILTLLRSLLEAVGKAFAGGSSSASSSATPTGPRGQAAQTLKKDPVCGTFVAADTAIQKSKDGETYYFCSAACRDKF